MQIRKLFSSFLSIILILSACTSPVSNAEQPFEGANRQAIITTVINEVGARLDAKQDFSQAEAGLVLPVGGQAQSGETGKARFDLYPDGTIIRLGPNTFFELIEINKDRDNPLTRLKLNLGELWIILSGGTLEVESEIGQASVRGSYLGVILSPDSGSLIALCLEGHCALSNEFGTVGLTDGQAAEIPAKGEAPSPPRHMTEDEIQYWREACPEAEFVLSPGSIPETGTTPPIELAPDDQNPPAEMNTNPPSRYHLNNTCPDPWHWKFAGATTILLTLAPGESASGMLPPGDYQATDWFDGGQSHGPNFFPAGGNLSVTGCPDTPNNAP